uniref:Uncharacterized protein n=1 Tax=Cannabis sativa TaxID=3483 RepID=A0A803R0Y9_CANSA
MEKIFRNNKPNWIPIKTSKKGIVEHSRLQEKQSEITQKTIGATLSNPWEPLSGSTGRFQITCTEY